MSQYWTAAGRDARVKELERRQARGIYGQLPYQQIIIDDIKAPLVSGVWQLTHSVNKLRAIRNIRLAFRHIDKLPEPSFANTWHPNSHRLVRLRDLFFKKYPLLRLLPFIRTGFNFFIMVYDYDHPYRDMVDFCFDEWLSLSPLRLGSGALLRQIKSDFFRRCRLTKDRQRLIRVVFDLAIVGSFLPPWRGIFRYCAAQLEQSGWEPRDSHDLIGHDWSGFWCETIPKK